MSRDSRLTAVPEQSRPAGKHSLNNQENYSLSATAPPAPPSPEEDDTYKRKQTRQKHSRSEPRQTGRKLQVREWWRDTDLRPRLTVTSDPLDPITRYCLLFWISTALQVIFFTSSTSVPEPTASNSARDETKRDDVAS